MALAIEQEEEAPPLVCRDIFSLTYLKQHLARAEGFPTPDEARPIYDMLRTCWLDNYVGLTRRREAYTRSQFLDPLLSELGWAFIPEQDLPSRHATHKRPDYCLFLDDQARKRAANETDTADVFGEAATVLEAKKVQHSLEKASERETPGLFPSQQVQDYLHKAKDRTGKRFFNWAILTNGNEWRLYCEQASTDGYFGFHLAQRDQFCSLEDFRFFLALFRPQAFAQDNEGRCLLDRLRQEALTRQAELETNLRKRIFDVLEDLANAFRDYPANQITKDDFQDLYDTALIFLYRLLFVLYAESRGLLPVKTSGYGSSKMYREKFSLDRLVEPLRNRNSYPSRAFTELYEDLLRLFRLINGEKPEQNRECKVTRYNGGLFDPKAHWRIEKWRVSDEALADVLRQLIFSQPPARPGARQQQIATEEAIDYRSLEVRQLGDIYEGLLGARLEAGDKNRLELRDERGQNHREGIFYTPDWVVQYLVREALQPLIDEAEASSDVRTARKARSEEKRRDNSFAHAVLRLNLVDPAMGSGHFLVRATEWLAEQIVYHPTTRLMTEQVVSTGQARRSRADIVKAGKIPVPPGVPQEQAEKAYWRRRVVEACIYGVDINPLAVELAKLALWLTCIAPDEPLNFLDHHLRAGNSLLWADPEEMHHLPVATEAEKKQTTFNIGPRMAEAITAVIAENVHIEKTESTEMELVKAKEARWKNVREKLRPFLYFADVWLAALDGLPLNELQYHLLARAQLAPNELDAKEKADAKKLRDSLAADIEAKRKGLGPFHWWLEFPDVFFETNGQPRPEAQRGFDAVLGNPPYVSTHTSSAEIWRGALERRARYLEDLYVHFTDLGFRILRPGAKFGFIVSDTFFTLASKLRMRKMLQANTLTHLGQCDPFNATVDAAIFVASKCITELPGSDRRTLFIQARPRKCAEGQSTAPEKDLLTLKPAGQISFSSATSLAGGLGEVQHGDHGCLRLHNVPTALYRSAHKQVFFEPRPGTLCLFEKLNEPVRRLASEWWDRIETSQKFAQNLPELRAYHASLKPGDVTLVGLVGEGGQGLATANNARFLGYLQGSPAAQQVKSKREEWTKRWLADPDVKPLFLQLLKSNRGDTARPTADRAAWEACVEPLKAKFPLTKLGFTKTDLYRIVPADLVAAAADFEFAWKRRKAELLAQWRTEPRLKGFWETSLQLRMRKTEPQQLRDQPDISDEDFCELCQQLSAWLEKENAARRESGQETIPRKATGLRSGENYTDPADAPRVATIYSGLSGRGQFVPFRKGDPEGNRWLDDEPLFIDWSAASVAYLCSSPKARWQGHEYFFLPGVSWTRGANHVAIKCKLVAPGVMDVNAMKLSPAPTSKIRTPFLLAVLNSDVFSFYLKKFLAHTWMAQISDLRMMPLVMPTERQAQRLNELAERAIEAKRFAFAGEPPPNDVVARVRQVADQLNASAPAYLRPPAQLKLLHTAADCLGIIELAVNWEAEKLYGVEGLGPFDEF
jgi:hypothetical protein